MPEEGYSALHDERFAAVGDLVVRAADQAWAELQLLQDQIINSSISGHASLKELEERKTQLLSDAAILGEMAVKINPEYVLGGKKDSAESTIIGNSNGNIKGARHNEPKTKTENVEAPDVDDYESLVEEYGILVEAEARKHLKAGLSSIHTRNSGASLHQRANSR